MHPLNFCALKWHPENMPPHPKKKRCIETQNKCRGTMLYESPRRAMETLLKNEKLIEHCINPVKIEPPYLQTPFYSVLSGKPLKMGKSFPSRKPIIIRKYRLPYSMLYIP